MSELNDMDSLLKEKYRRQRKEEWKKKIPIPSSDIDEPKESKVSKPLIYLAGMALLIIGALLIQNNKSKNIIPKMIDAIPLASYETEVLRGEEKDLSDVSEDIDEVKKFYNAVYILKYSDAQLPDAIKTFEYFANYKNPYQLDALWMKALAHAKSNDKKLAIKALDKLSASGTYQQQNIVKLLDHLTK